MSARTLARPLLIVALTAFVACGGDGDAPGNGAPVTPVQVETVDDDPAGTAQALIDCLAQADVEAQVDEGDPFYGEVTRVDLTAEQVEPVPATIPGAVRVWFYASADEAQTGQAAIDEDRLEGSAPLIVVGTIVIDDGGTYTTHESYRDFQAALFACVPGAGGS